jgi:proteic killer suppression protein
MISINKQIVYNSAVIESFSSDETETLFATGKSRRLPPEILKRALMRLTQLHAATEIDDLRMPPSNRLEALLGDLAGKWSFASMTAGVCAFGLKADMRMRLKLWITTKEYQR